MKRRSFIKKTSISTAAIAVIPLTGSSMFQKKEVAMNYMRPVDNKKALVNPDMGWTMHYYSNVILKKNKGIEKSNK